MSWLSSSAGLLNSIMEFVLEFASLVRGMANWRLVRSLAELQILTRASYAMLIIVPILAGMWPAVRLVVNQYDKAVVEAMVIFDRAADRFKEFEGKLPSFILKSEPQAGAGRQPVSVQQDDPVDINSFRAAADDFKRHVAQYKTDYASRTIESSRMPRPFAAAFMAALAVVFAHTLYQMFAPETLRRMTLDQYVTDRMDDYSKRPTPESLRRAQFIIEHPTLRFPGLALRVRSRGSELVNEIERRDGLDSEALVGYLRSLSPIDLQRIPVIWKHILNA